mgnify:CR=1 FL=1
MKKTDEEQKEVIKELDEDLQSLEEQLEEAKEAIAALKEENLRDRADLENWRRRMIRDKEDSIRFANERLISDLLGPLDDFERALEAAEETKDFSKIHDGVILVSDQIYSTLQKNWGLERIEAVGKEFDPNEHEAYQVVEDENLEHETVLEEYATGYKLHGRVLRPSKVKVGRPNI